MKFLIIFIVLFYCSALKAKDINLETITIFIEKYKNNLDSYEVVVQLGENCFNQAKGIQTEFLSNENCILFKKYYKLIAAEFGIFNLEFLEIVKKIVNGQVTAQAEKYYEKNLYIYKNISGEVKQLYLTEWGKIVSDQSLSIGRKLEMQGFIFN
jgi:hypothetical protein